jgi:hypothetical protein
LSKFAGKSAGNMQISGSVDAYMKRARSYQWSDDNTTENPSSISIRKWSEKATRFIYRQIIY